jgi:hypothetical protein
MAALQIRNIPTGTGDDIKFDVSYAKGHTKNVIATSGTSPNFSMFGGSGTRLPERRFRGDHVRRLSSRRSGYRRYPAYHGLGSPRCLQSKLECQLVEQPVRKLLQCSI